MQQSPRPTHWTDIPTHSITGNSPDLSSGMHWIYPFNDPMDNFANDLKLSGKRFTVNLNLKPHHAQPLQGSSKKKCLADFLNEK